MSTAPRADELKRQYTGAICGLGFDVASDESIYSEHDMELTFDTLISQDDLKMVQMYLFSLCLVSFPARLFSVVILLLQLY